MPKRSQKIVILAGIQADGTAYALHPTTKKLLRDEFSAVRQAPSVFVGFDNQADFETLHGPMWSQIAILLTGLTTTQLKEFAGVEIHFPASGKIVQVEV